MEQEFKYLAERFYYYTECNLATLEQLESRKSSSNSDKVRQTAICGGMVDVAKTYRATVEIPKILPRLRKLTNAK